MKELALGVVIGGILVAAGALFIAPVFQNEQSNEQPLGSASSPSVVDGCMEINGVTSCYREGAFISATTTPITVKTPAATSTLALGSGCHFTTASTSAKAIRFAKALLQNATTTFLFGANSAASEPRTVVATTSTDNFVFGPNQYLSVSLVGGTGVDSPAGFCAFTFIQLQ